MSTLNPPVPVLPQPKLGKKVLNFFLGNPVRALLTCLICFWLPTILTIWKFING